MVYSVEDVVSDEPEPREDKEGPVTKLLITIDDVLQPSIFLKIPKMQQMDMLQRLLMLSGELKFAEKLVWSKIEELRKTVVAER